jgi:alpha-L-rhamnosidase
MVANGATTIWECWGREFAGENSRTDTMSFLGGVVNFFYDDLAGIEAPEFYGSRHFEPGYKRITIKPNVLGDLTFAQASIKTVRGIISSSWKRTDDSLTLKVTIPVNSQAKISVPKIGLNNVNITESGKTIYKNGKLIKRVPGITTAANTKDYVTFETGSGSYRFVLNGQK